MKQIKKAISFSVVIALSIAGVIYGNNLAFNVCAFISPLSAVLYILCVAMKPESLLATYRKGEHLPEWLDKVFYCILVVLYAAHAHWILAFCWFCISTCDFALREMAKPKTKQPTEADCVAR